MRLFGCAEKYTLRTAHSALQRKAMLLKVHLLEASLLQQLGDQGAGQQPLLLLLDLLDRVWEGVVQDVVGGAPHNQHEPIRSQPLSVKQVRLN